SLKFSDVICLNRYYGWYFGGPDLEIAEEMLRKELDFWKTTGKPVMFTEYGADTVAGFHDTMPQLYTEEYQVDFYKMNNTVFDDYAFVVGEHAWYFADFATSQSMMRINGNKKGIFTRERKPKMVAHYFRERWQAIPDFDYKK
ncbi:glycoside hydrolase family 2 TIM barrel-domain containing protein, partial [Treponema sp.]|uniref:glycoside hydrolase family 2 TIM barrel-domain containing protein n=1 Tax=Treponema sp. TaxID=166 RepID=UPI00388D1E01